MVIRGPSSDGFDARSNGTDSAAMFRGRPSGRSVQVPDKGVGAPGALVGHGHLGRPRSVSVSTSNQRGSTWTDRPRREAFSRVIENTASVLHGTPTNRSGLGDRSPMR